jgi:hypothetical protein
MQRLNFYKRCLSMLLTATPRTTYDSAYANRGSLLDQFASAYFDRDGAPQVLQWLLFDLARDGITYSEQSCNVRTARYCT